MNRSADEATLRAIPAHALRGGALLLLVASCGSPTAGGDTPDPNAGAGLEGPPMAAADAGPTGPSASCTPLGTLTLTNASSTFFAGTTPLYRIGATLPAGLAGPGTSVMWAWGTGTATARSGATIRLQDSAANRSFGSSTEVIMVGVNCPEGGGLFDCPHVYESVLGYARFDALATAPGQAFSGSFTGVELREVTVDLNTYESHFTGSGACLSLDTYAFTSTTRSSCPGNDTCGSCTAAAGCGWCANTGQCLPGTQSAPDNGACGGAQWSWTSDMCTADAGAPPMDAGTPPRDAGAPDVGVPDVGTPDVGVPDVGMPDAGITTQPHTESATEVSGAATAAQVSPYRTCSATADCGSSAPSCLHGTGHTNGVCSLTCTRDADCADSALCISFGSSGGRCLRLCPSGGCDTTLRCGSFRSTTGTTGSVCLPDYW